MLPVLAVCLSVGGALAESPLILGGCDWQLTFEDNFDGPALDLSRWTPTYSSGRTEWQRYVPAAVQVQAGLLRLRAEPLPAGGHAYTSGAVNTRGTFSQQYGRFEIRVQVPAGQGLWPAFWLLPEEPHYPDEIDVFEFLGHQPETLYFSNHWADAAGEHRWLTQSYHGPDFSAGFHTISVDWQPTELVWSVDGVETARSYQGIPRRPMFLIANLAVGGSWPGYPDAATPFPSDVLIDYIRVYAWQCLPFPAGWTRWSGD